MKRKDGTTDEQWAQYEIDLREFTERMMLVKPRLEQYTADDGRFEKDMSAWRMALSCDAPNQPGYYRANND